MIWLAVVLLCAWILGWAVFHIAGALIHLLLVVAVAVFLYRLITGRRTVWMADWRALTPPPAART